MRARQVAVALILGLGCATAAAAAAAEPLPAGAFVLPCGDGEVEVGDPRWRWALDDGFYADEPGGDRSATWTGRDAALVLLAAWAPTDPPARLVLELTPAAPEQTLTVSLGGRALGTRTLRPGWHRESWEVPADAVVAGPNLVRLELSETHRVGEDRRDLGVRIDRAALEPASACPPAEPAPAKATADARWVPPGASVIVPVAGAVRARLELAAEDGGLEAFVVTTAGTARAITTALPGGDAVTIAAPAASRRPLLFVLGAAGRPVAIERLRIVDEEGFWLRRRACGLLAPAAACFLAALAFILLAVLFLPRLVPPEGRAGAIAGLLVVVSTALAVRALYLWVYPDPGHGGDAWEYLMRSQLLASGEVPFLGSSRWHAWQTWTRPPGYYLFLAGLHRLPGTWEGWLVWSQALFSAAAAGAVYGLGLTLFGRRAALAAGLLFALSAESVLSFSRVLGEPLYMLFVVPALVALARTSTAPRWRWAAAAGALFGLACYVRSAPLFFAPVAAVLLLWIHGPRRGWKPAAWLVAMTVAVVAPWMVRNSIVHEVPMGIDDLSVINLLQVWPDDEIVPTLGADLDDPKQFRRYYTRLQRANSGNQLTRRSGEITRRTIGQLLREPGLAARRFAGNLGGYFSPFDQDWLRRSLGEERICRRILLTDLINGGTYLLLLLAVAGLALAFRRREIWPVVAWFLFNGIMVNLFFHPEPKYRFPTLPVAFVLAGFAIAWALGRRGEGASARGPGRAG